MQDFENHLAKARFARRHLTKVAGIGLAALVARLAMPKPAHARKWEDHDHDRDDRRDADDYDHHHHHHHCFLKGTKVRTITGEREVQDLAVGDLLPTHADGIRPIQWIGRYRFTRSDISKPWARDVLPVRVARSALAPNVPHSDLYLTQPHAIFTDGALVRVGSLVNGSTIALHDADEVSELEYYHIKLQTHDVIYAEGALSETLLELDQSAVTYVPVLSFTGSRSKMASPLRSALSPLVDRREKIDIIRDRLEDRALTMG